MKAVLASAWLACLVGPTAVGAEAEIAFRLRTGAAGVYRVTHAELVAAGLGPEALPSADLALSNRGRLVPLWVNDGGNALFAAGDGFEFVAEEPPGEGEARTHEYSLSNVYRLFFDAAAARRMEQRSPSPSPSSSSLSVDGGTAVGWQRRLHLENDQLLIRLAGHEVEERIRPELWYWTKLTHVDPGPTRIAAALPGLDVDSTLSITGEIRFRGLSERTRRPAGDRLPDHDLILEIGGKRRGRAVWDGRREYRMPLRLPVALMTAGDNQLSLRLPVRQAADGEAIVDVVMLDWLDLSYPHTGLLGSEQLRLEVDPRDGLRGLARVAAPAPVVAYGDGGSRIELGADGAFSIDGVDDAFWFAQESNLLSAAIERDRPSDLAAITHQADYLMIAHPRLLAASEQLAQFHRSRGLEVALVDVQDVYDEFNHGLEDPLAIKRFIAHAYDNWRRPRPRYVLLVGDASWDTKLAVIDDANYANWTARQLTAGERFRVKPGPVYDDEPERNNRNLIPAWNFHSAEGHSASDNWYVAVAGDDHLPDLAIGRLPVVTPAEVEAITDKTVRYVATPELGPWRRQLVWISNSSDAVKRRSDALAGELSRRGFVANKVYPPDREVRPEHQQTLIDAFSRGHLITHFLGHGGRYIWRTAAPDLKHETDLFSLEHLEAVEPSARLPIVLSLTCHSGPFDHPNANSIAEGFLRLPGKGAIAVLAASWRNVPTEQFSRVLVDELTRPGTIGEAIRRAKRRVGDRELVETYNLLGDPAVPIALPAATVELRLQPLAAGGRELLVELPPAAVGGRLVISWQAVGGEMVLSEEHAVTGEQLRLPVPAAEALTTVSVYFWHQAEQIDGLGGLTMSDASGDALTETE